MYNVQGVMRALEVDAVYNVQGVMRSGYKRVSGGEFDGGGRLMVGGGEWGCHWSCNNNRLSQREFMCP